MSVLDRRIPGPSAGWPRPSERPSGSTRYLCCYATQALLLLAGSWPAAGRTVRRSTRAGDRWRHRLRNLELLKVRVKRPDPAAVVRLLPARAKFRAAA